MPPLLPPLLLRAFLCTAAIAFVLLFIASLRLFSSSSLHLHLTAFSIPSRSFAILQPDTPPLKPTASILLPDSDLLLILPPQRHPLPPFLCLFPSTESSPASPVGILPWSRRRLLRCPLPSSVRKHNHIPPPLLVHLHQSPVLKSKLKYETQSEVIRWNSLVYEALSTPADIVLFAKGINNHKGISEPISKLRCIFLLHNSPVSLTAVTSSTQEVFRCNHPDNALPADTKITLIWNGTIFHSIAQYTPPPLAYGKEKSLICACTMVRNVAKFLREWVLYHSRVGVDRFILYDNDSEDELNRVVTRLREEGHDVSTYLWPWPKTQEAGFSHAAVLHRETCAWMMYLDVDEFVYLPGWVRSDQPKRDMLPSVLPNASDPVGQVMIYCRDFGPSGLREHPGEGVMQGYTCRMKAEERHKSLVRLDSVDDSLQNVVHHFKIKEGYGSKKMVSSEAVVNHYKYQAWSEFRHKFTRRVSAYVVDWTRAVNAASKDRVPGLGFEAVEPEDWPRRFCEVRDTRLKELTRRWFGRVGPDGSTQMVWEES